MKSKYSDKTDMYLLHFWFWHPDYEDREEIKRELDSRSWKKILDRTK